MESNTPEMTQYFDSLDSLLKYTRSTKNEYLIKATENTINNGYTLSDIQVPLSNTKTKTVSKKILKNLEIEFTEYGFVIWAKNRKGNRSYWLIDASTLTEDATISLGRVGINLFEKGVYKYSAKINPELNRIEIVELDKNNG